MVRLVLLSARRKQGMIPSVGVGFRAVCCEGGTGRNETTAMVVVVVTVVL